MRYSIFFIAMVCFLSSAAICEDQKGPWTEEQMAAFQKASAPQEQHTMLQRYVGKWNHTVKWWMKPDSEPEVSTGQSEIELILGGRFIKQKVTGMSMGQPFEGIGITGYDNVQKHFSSIWLDNMSTGMMVGNGEFNSTKNAIVDRGSFSCPLEASGKKSYRAVWGMPQGNSFKYEMFSDDEHGKEFRMMEITYTKAS